MSDNTTLHVYCACGYYFPDAAVARQSPAVPCPKCGKVARKYDLHCADEITLNDGVRGIGYVGSVSKWFAKFYEKRELFRKTGRWHRIRRRFDKRTDEYEEVIHDEKSGALVRSHSEPLSKHRGHGSARKKST